MVEVMIEKNIFDSTTPAELTLKSFWLKRNARTDGGTRKYFTETT